MDRLEFWLRKCWESADDDVGDILCEGRDRVRALRAEVERLCKMPSVEEIEAAIEDAVEAYGAGISRQLKRNLAESVLRALGRGES